MLAIATRFSPGRRVKFPVPTHDRGMIEYLADLMASGAFVPMLDRTYPLEQIVEALRVRRVRPEDRQRRHHLHLTRLTARPTQFRPDLVSTAATRSVENCTRPPDQAAGRSDRSGVLPGLGAAIRRQIRGDRGSGASVRSAARLRTCCVPRRRSRRRRLPRRSSCWCQHSLRGARAVRRESRCR